MRFGGTERISWNGTEGKHGTERLRRERIILRNGTERTGTVVFWNETERNRSGAIWSRDVTQDIPAKASQPSDLSGWSPGPMAGWLAGWLTWPACPALGWAGLGWLAGWLAGWLVGWLVGWLGG